MKKHKYLIYVVLFALIGIIIYLTGVFELNNINNYGELGIDKKGFYTNSKDLLPKELKKIYDEIDESVYSLNSDVDINNVKKDDVKKVIEYYKADNPQVFWLKSDFSLEQEIFTNDIIGASLEYYYVDNTTNEHIAFTKDLVLSMNNKLEQESMKILDSVKTLTSEYDKVKYIHDYIISTVTYDEQANFAHNAYGALVEKRAVCDGLSKAYMYLLSQIGIESYIAYGKTNEGVAHSWNVVKIDNEYYNIDLTWDLPQGDSDTVLYANFCITDEQIKKSRDVYSPSDTNNSEYLYAKIPVCQSTKYNYYVKEGLLIDEYNDEKLNYILDLITDTTSKKLPSIQIKFENSDDFDNFIDELTKGTNDLFYRFPYSNDKQETIIKTLDIENIVIFEFEYK